MRRTLLSALTGIAVVLTGLVGTQAAVAEPATGTQAATTISYGVIVSDGGPLVAGETSSYDATLTKSADGSAIAGMPVILEARPAGAASFAQVASAVTDVYGEVTASTKLIRTSELRWRFAGDDSYQPTVTAAFVQPIATRVGIRGSDLSLRIGQRLVVTGRTFPAKPGTRVTLWRGRYELGYVAGPEPVHVRIAVGVVRADGSIRFVHRFAHTGTKRLYLRVAAGGGNIAGYSRYLVVRVR